MKCSEVKRKLSAFLDGEIPSAGKKEIIEHLETCRGCQEELAALSEVMDALGVLEGMEPPPYFITRVRQSVREEGKPVPFLERIRSVAISFATAAAVVTSVLIGNQFGRTLYQSVAPAAISETAETGDIFGFGTLEEFPDGSLSDIYDELIAGGNNG
ncbi:MAG: zf-HC2 domain-containing protein [candidate division WOR-3 bacterium]|nr:MAG: zf-HC2 domain-containing protein [candidate division WOR-3 bacterium]